MRNMPKRYLYPLLTLALLLTTSVVACAQPAPSPAPPTPLPPAEVTPWHQAKNYVGEVKVVEGPVVSATWASGSKGKPTFLNIGNPYPNPNRFTVVIWIDHRDKFIKAFPPNPETYFLNKTVRVKGLITSYKGIPQIELQDPSNIWIVK